MIHLLSEEISLPQLMQTLQKWKYQVILKHGQKPGQRKTKHQNGIREEEAREDQNTWENSLLTLLSSNTGAPSSSNQVQTQSNLACLGAQTSGSSISPSSSLGSPGDQRAPKEKKTTKVGCCPDKPRKNKDIVENVLEKI